ncbi:MAG: hypothetical protein AB8F95_00405 [Bacteroidia bacterium]
MQSLHPSISLIVVIITMSVLNTGFGQSPKIKQYRTTIYQAEMNVAEGDWTKAINLYKQAFAVNKDAFAKDLYNASITATLEGNIDSAKAWFTKLVEREVTKERLKQHLFYKKHLSSSVLKIMIADAEAKRQYPNPELIQKIDSFFARDQYLRRNGSISEIQAQDERSGAFMDSIILHHGYPKDSEIGVDRADNFYIMHLHADFNPKRANFLKREVIAGNMQAFDYMGIYGRWNYTQLNTRLQTGDTTMTPMGFFQAKYFGLKNYSKDKLILHNGKKRHVFKGSPNFRPDQIPVFDKRRSEIGFKSCADHDKWLNSPYVKKYGFLDTLGYYH